MTNSTQAGTAKVIVPQSKTDASAVAFEEIPLPPEEFWTEAEGETQPSSSTEKVQAAPVEEPPTEELDFIDEEHHRRVPLKHKFRRNGQVVDAIVVKRLTLGQVDGFVRRTASGPFSTFDIYAVMTGLPASVLRGLVDVDGDAVVDAAYDFLPRMLKGESGSTET